MQKWPWGTPLMEATALHQELNLGATQQTLSVPPDLQLPLQGHRFDPNLHASVREQTFENAKSHSHLFPLGAQNHQWNTKQLQSNLAHQSFTSGCAVTHCPVQLWATSTKFVWNLACSFYAAALCFLWIFSSFLPPDHLLIRWCLQWKIFPQTHV